MDQAVERYQRALAAAIQSRGWIHIYTLTVDGVITKAWLNGVRYV